MAKKLSLNLKVPVQKKLTKDEKIHLVANMPEVITAIKTLAAVMIEAKIKNFIQYEYDVEDISGPTQRFRFRFEKIQKPKTKK